MGMEGHLYALHGILPLGWNYELGWDTGCRTMDEGSGVELVDTECVLGSMVLGIPVSTEHDTWKNRQ